jgi:hypothetical protein
LEDHPFSAVRGCLFSRIAATLRNGRASPPSATWGRAMPWWQGTPLFDKIVFDRKYPRKHMYSFKVYFNISVGKHYGETSITWTRFSPKFRCFELTDTMVYKKNL